MVFIILIYIFMISACVSDVLWKRISNYLLLLLFFSYIFLDISIGNYVDILYFILKMLIVSACFYPIFKIGAIGAGDVKLLALCSGFFKKDKLLYFIFISMFISAIFSIIKLFKEKNLRERFLYLKDYMQCIFFVEGRPRVYLQKGTDKKSFGICMSIPIFLGIVFMEVFGGGVFL